MKVVLFCGGYGMRMRNGAADDVPKPYTFARYQAMMDRSPFAVATAVATANGERSIIA